ncbi:MAG: hypothetical protein J6Q20_01885 [Alistipes sp.]|nr:hypothetical protein [Alistipes sp.]
MKKMFLSALAVAALAFVGCTEDATNDLAQNGGAAVELHEITFEAEIEQPSRTSLVDPGTGTSYVCWDADDAIAILTDDGKVYKATVNSEAGKPWATFSATISGNAVAAVYPYSFAGSDGPSITCDSDVTTGKIGLLFPNFQSYKEGSVFGDNINAMVGLCTTGSNGMKFAMKSVMGALELKFKGSQKVQGITVKGSNSSVKLSGLGYATIANDGGCTLNMYSGFSALSYVNLEVPDVVLNSGTATSFYVLVPAGTYDALQIGVMTEDGSYVRTATQAHTVKAGEIKPINCGNLDTMIDKASAISLSDSQYANCYAIVPDNSVKTYSFEIKRVDGSTPSNNFLNNNNKDIENSSESLQPHMAQILWAEEMGIAYDIHFNREEGKIYFKHDGKTLGNMRIMLTCDPFAVAKSRAINTGKTDDTSTTIREDYVCDFNEKAIYVKRAEQCFIWGWHIWSTPTKLDYSEFRIPAGATDSNGDGSLSASEIRKKGRLGWMDRNLGATWLAKTKSALDNATDQNFVDAIGLYYEFGNVTPYPRPEHMKSHTETNFGFTRTKYHYGFHQHATKWTSSSSFKTTLDETLQFPYHYYATSYTPKGGTQKPTAAADLTKYKAHFNTDIRNSWINLDFKGSGKLTDTPPAFWGTSQGGAADTHKGIYDPCPPGYMIPHQGNIYQTCTGQTVKFLPNGSTTPISQNAGAFSEVCTRKINDIPVGTYITFDGTNIDFWPNSSYSSEGKMTFNKSGNFAYIWGIPYSHQIENYSYTSGGVSYGPYTSYNCGARGTFNASGTGSYYHFWPQAATGYNVRCMKYVPTASTSSVTASYNVDEATGF